MVGFSKIPTKLVSRQNASYKKKPRKKREAKCSCRWAFTDYSLDELKFQEFCKNPKVKLLCFQLEIGSKTQHEHLQGFVRFTRHYSRNSVKNLFNDHTLHLEPARGSDKQNRKYCTDPKKRKLGAAAFVYGTDWSDKTQGRRTDLETLVDMVKKGMTDCEILEEMPGHYLLYQKNIRAVRATLESQLTHYMPQKNYCFWGDTRAGKTKGVFDLHDPRDVFMVTVEDGRLWFDKYQGQKILLIDEFSGQVPWNVLKSVLDDYKRRCHVKGGFVYKQWDTVYITSQIHPEDWYPEIRPEDLMALAERFEEVTFFENPKYKNNPGPIWKNRRRGEKLSVTFSPLPHKKAGISSFLKKNHFR